MEIVQANEGDSSLTNVSMFINKVEIRKQLKVIGEFDATLDYCEYLIRVEMHKHQEARYRNKKRKKELNKELIRSLKNLTLSEKIYYFSTLVNQLHSITNDIFLPPIIEQTSFLIIEAFSRSYNLKIWKKKKIRFDRQKHIVYAEKDKKIKIYDLSNYMIRISNTNDYFCLVLEAINEIPHERSRTIHIGFEFSNTYKNWFHSLRLSTQYKQWERIVDRMNKRQKYLCMKLKSKMESEEIYQSSLSEIKEIKSNVSIEENQTQFFVTPIKNRKDNQFYHTQFEMKISEDKNYRTQNYIKQTDSNSSIRNIVLPQSTFLYRLISNKLNLSAEALQLTLQIQKDFIKEQKLRVDFRKIITPYQKFDKFDHFNNYESINLGIEQTNPKMIIQIYQNKAVVNNFKLRLALQSNLDETNELKQNLVESILDPHLCCVSNTAIKKVQIKSLICSQNSSINYQQNINYNKLYRPRDFIYLRHVMNDEKDMFIIDKSIINNNYPEVQGLVRGSLEIKIRIRKQQKQIQLIADILMSHGGKLEQLQDVNLTKIYIKYFIKGIITLIGEDLKKDGPVQRFYDYDFPRKGTRSFLSELNDQNEQLGSSNSSLSKISIGEQVNQRQSTASFYKIQRNQIFFTDSDSNHKIYPKEGLFEFQANGLRKLSNQYLNPHAKIPFLKSKHSQKMNWRIQIEPKWKKQWKIDTKDGSLIYNLEQDQQFKKKLKRLLEATTKVSLSGKKIEKISFPVDILAHESDLERSLKSLSYAPFIFSGCQHMSITQKFQKSIVFGISISLLSLNTNKSFTPLLGETYQASIDSQWQGFAQQINDYPQIIGLQVLSKQLYISASISPILNIKMNSVSGECEGVYRIRFKDGLEICFTLPKGQLSGLLFDQKRIELQGKCFFWIETERIILELNFDKRMLPQINKQHDSNHFEGTIYEVSSKFMSEFAIFKNRPEETQITAKRSKVTGRWSQYIKFGEADPIYFQKLKLYQMVNEENPLQSDSTLRNDIIELKKMNLDKSQQFKDQYQKNEKYTAKLRKKKKNK